MSKDPTIRKVLIVGSGPIVIGQAAEFDYAGTQACISCREEGVEVVLVNSNPATIQTDPGTADVVYIEPLTVESLADIIERERPDGLIATMGGQTALNLAMDLERAGVLSQYGVRVLGTSTYSIRLAEDRQTFADLMESIGQPVPAHAVASDLWAAAEFAERNGYPVVVRAPFSLGGAGSGHAESYEELEQLVGAGLASSPLGSVLLDRSLAGWAEIEYEVLRDAEDNAIIVCNMENMDPLGVHTGESIVVAPSQTLSDGDYQRLRTAALDIVRALDVRGGCNCQFALNQQTGELAVIEVNPRLSRSSALASKATGYPIARVAAKIALGYTLAELRNDITGASACAEPALDYVVVKLPRWPFDKFRGVDPRIGVTMKSTGEVMAIGRSFEQAFLKALRSLDVRSSWLEVNPAWTPERIAACLARPTHKRPAAIYNALANGWSVPDIAATTRIHPWFIERLAAIYHMEQECRRALTDSTLRAAKRMGFSDDQLAATECSLPGVRGAPCRGFGGVPQYSPLPFPFPGVQGSPCRGFGGVPQLSFNLSFPLSMPTPFSMPTDFGKPIAPGSTPAHPAPGPARIRDRRRNLGLLPTYKMVDTCAGEFAASTPYFYSTYEYEDEARPLPGPKVIVLGSGPIRIGQGIEFDYSSVHAVQALRAAGVGAVVINNNPETVSTDYHLSDRLYFEPLTLEEVLNVVEHERDGLLGVIAQFGGQTALNLVRPLSELGVPILGTPPDSIAATEDRKQMAGVCERLGIPTPAWTIAHSQDELEEFAPRLGFPVLVRPSYVLGGRGMKIVRDLAELRSYLDDLAPHLREHPVLVDRFLEDAVEVDVDGISDGRDTFTVVMEQIEPAGIHSGDSACVYPPQTLPPQIVAQIRSYTHTLAQHLGVVGLINVQYAVKDGKVYLLEVNARASRTVPFASKATGLPLARLATRLILGDPLSDLEITPRKQGQVSVKAVVLPFDKFPSLDRTLGPEMQSTGERMGIAPTYPEALAKAGYEPSLG